MSILADFHPITRAPGLIEAPLEHVASAARAILERAYQWELRFFQADRDRPDWGSTTFDADVVESGLREALNRLLPLSSGITTHHLFLHTINKLTAYYNNNRLAAGDPALIGLLSENLNARAVYAFCQDNTLKRLKEGNWQGFYGGYKFHVYMGSARPERAIECLNDGGRWVFDQVGNPYPFEDVSRYSAPRKRDRFDGKTLQAYLQRLDLRPFDDDFFVVDSKHPAQLIMRNEGDPVVRGRIRFHSLDDVRSNVS